MMDILEIGVILGEVLKSDGFLYIYYIVCL